MGVAVLSTMLPMPPESVIRGRGPTPSLSLPRKGRDTEREILRRQAGLQQTRAVMVEIFLALVMRGRKAGGRREAGLGRQSFVDVTARLRLIAHLAVRGGKQERGESDRARGCA